MSGDKRNGTFSGWMGRSELGSKWINMAIREEPSIGSNIGGGSILLVLRAVIVTSVVRSLHTVVMLQPFREPPVEEQHVDLEDQVD